MAKRDFNQWMSGFKDTINSFDYYVDFPKVYENVSDCRTELTLMNVLIGSEHIEEDFDLLLKAHPEVIRCIPILVALRARNNNSDFKVLYEHNVIDFNFLQEKNTPGEYREFMQETGLFELLASRKINNLVDYVTGVEVGLDSNGRKNRGGTNMEKLVEGELKGLGCRYRAQMSIDEIQREYGLDLSPISNDGKTTKRFDFVVKTEHQVYAIEVNFYGSSGSKLNETARSYKMIAKEAAKVDGFTFVWITDGTGWKSARHNLEETFDVLDTVYCLKDLEEGALKRLFSQ